MLGGGGRGWLLQRRVRPLLVAASSPVHWCRRPLRGPAWVVGLLPHVREWMPLLGLCLEQIEAARLVRIRIRLLIRPQLRMRIRHVCARVHVRLRPQVHGWA